MFMILVCVDALNEHLQLGFKWHDVVHLYEFHSQSNRGFYLKSRSPIVSLISCPSKSNKGMKDDYLITSGAWYDGLHFLVREGVSGGIA